MPRIYLSPPHMSGPEQQYVQETCASNWLAPLGPQVEQNGRWQTVGKRIMGRRFS